jgi:D-alanyl-D-alanine dipeptidase
MTIAPPAQRGTPPLPPPHLSPWIGQYGQATPLLDLFEDGGELHVEGDGFSSEPLKRAGEASYRDPASSRILRFGRDDGDIVVSVDGETYRKRDFGADLIADFQRSLDPAALLRTDHTVPRSVGTVDLVPVAEAAPSIRLDIRYATADNFTGRPIYNRACAFVRPVVAAALARVQARLLASGYGLLLFDAYRPWAVTEMFWTIVPLRYRAFVADPAVGSKHNRGCAVDLSLCDAATGEEIEMPSRYDEPTARSHHAYRGGTALQRWHRDTLRLAMEQEGFAVQPDEWWHFDFGAWQDYPIETIGFGDLAKAR